MSVVHVIDFVHHSGDFRQVTWSFVDVNELSVTAAAPLAVHTRGHVTCQSAICQAISSNFTK